MLFLVRQLSKVAFFIFLIMLMTRCTAARVQTSASIQTAASLSAGHPGDAADLYLVVQMGLDRRERIYYMDGIDSVADNGTEYTDRISVQEEDYTLAISNVGLSDERAFICQVGGMSAGNGENRTELRVYGRRRGCSCATAGLLYTGCLLFII